MWLEAGCLFWNAQPRAPLSKIRTYRASSLFPAKETARRMSSCRLWSACVESVVGRGEGTAFREMRPARGRGGVSHTRCRQKHMRSACKTGHLTSVRSPNERMHVLNVFNLGFALWVTGLRARVGAELCVTVRCAQRPVARVRAKNAPRSARARARAED